MLDGVPVAVKDMIAVKGLPMFEGKVSSNPDPGAHHEPCPCPSQGAPHPHKVPSAERRASPQAEDDEIERDRTRS